MSRSRKRIFLVGCPRSGTTLLQSIIAAHPDLTTYPETHFFPWVVDRGRRGRLQLVSRHAYDVVAELASRELPYQPPRFHPTGVLDPRLTSWTRSFVTLLDDIAESRGARGWLEKTPRHLRYVEPISRHIPDAYFIHLIRGGRATVKSLAAVRLANPKVWKSPTTDAHAIVLDSARRWAADVTLSHTFVNRTTHSFVRFEDLVDDPPGVATELLKVLGLSLESTQITDLLGKRTSATAAFSLPWETWKSNVHSPIGSRPLAAASATDDIEQPAVEKALASVQALFADIPFIRSDKLRAVHVSEGDGRDR